MSSWCAWMAQARTRMSEREYNGYSVRLELQAGSTGGGPGVRHVSFKDFEGGLAGGGALDSALALIEHLVESLEIKG